MLLQIYFEIEPDKSAEFEQMYSRLEREGMVLERSQA